MPHVMGEDLLVPEGPMLPDKQCNENDAERQSKGKDEVFIVFLLDQRIFSLFHFSASFVGLLPSCARR